MMALCQRYTLFYEPLLKELGKCGFKSVRGRYDGDNTRAFFVHKRFGNKIRYGVTFGRDDKLRIELVIDGKDASRIYEALRPSKSAIEAELIPFRNLHWDPKPGRQRKRIALTRSGA